jgi:glycosyltransferase involved in cell wall biosynthesis
MPRQAPQAAPITAVICTRNRGRAILKAAETVLSNTHPSFSLIVIDQSTTDDTAACLAPLISEGKLTYIRTTTVGVSRSRNLGLRTAGTEIVAFTDDDCEVPPTWLEELQAVFSEQPSTAMVFCSVLAGPHSSADGFVPAYECQGTRTVHTLLDKCTARGMGAGLAIRREPVLALGGFDEELGPGGRFPSCEEGDAAVRCLLRGHDVCETSRTHVIHHGFRTWSEGRELSRRDWFGIGAAYAKPLRAGRWDFMPVPAYELMVKAVWPPIMDMLRLRRPKGLTRGLYFVRGFAKGLVEPLNPDPLVFRSR